MRRISSWHLLTWTKEEYGTDVEICDDQHQELFRMLNDLHDTAASGNRLQVGNQLDALINYEVMHFQTEEKLMQQKGYANFAAHKAEHDKLVATCADLQRKFHAGTAQITQDTTRFVRDWLNQHIPAIDMPYGSCLNG